MKLLAIGRPREQPDMQARIAQLAVAEMRALWELYRAGVVREMYSPAVRARCSYWRCRARTPRAPSWLICRS